MEAGPGRPGPRGPDGGHRDGERLGSPARGRPVRQRPDGGLDGGHRTARDAGGLVGREARHRRLRGLGYDRRWARRSRGHRFARGARRCRARRRLRRDDRVPRRGPRLRPAKGSLSRTGRAADPSGSQGSRSATGPSSASTSPLCRVPAPQEASPADLPHSGPRSSPASSSSPTSSAWTATSPAPTSS